MSNNWLALATPTVARRLISMVYEALLVTAVLCLVVLTFLLATQNRQSQTYAHALQFVLFLTAAAYFIHFWSREGQTLAMKTWRIRLVKPGHEREPVRVAAARYFLAWMWFVPGLLLNYALGLKAWPELGVMAAGMALWAATALLDKDRQFLHDRLLGTRLIQLPKVTKKLAAG